MAIDAAAHAHPHKKTTQIVINGHQVEVYADELSFEELVALAYPGPQNADVFFTITYRRGQGHKPEGSLAAGQPPVKLKEGMIFNVVRTNKS